MFSYQDSRAKIKHCLNKIERSKKGYGDLKKLLLDCQKHNYLSSYVLKIKANTKIGRASLITVANAFCDLQLVTQKTIKDRGWTDKLIKDYLQVDIYAKNPYYKTSGDMKLYCLSRVENLECFNSKVNFAVTNNKLKRQKSKDKKEQRLATAPFKWLDSIGDPDIAIALLLRLLNQAIKNDGHYESRKAFYCLKVKILDKLKPYKVQTFIARKELFNKLLYCHWFNINGYKLSFHSYDSLDYKGSFSLEQYDIKFDSTIVDSDKKLLFKLSGWRTINEAIKGLQYLSDREIKGSFKLKTNNINKFTPPQYPDPPTEDDLFVLKLNQNKKYMLINFNARMKEIKQYKEKGCPLNFNCELMGGINKYRCSNYEKCKRAIN